mmetsp:Transcript_26602/g.82261  ORF Transcript_26602/g.82261 Transcript_26602/m.82261 type:complete len:221 (-) Transcript_26602:490-1152(-)
MSGGDDSVERVRGSVVVAGCVASTRRRHFAGMMIAAVRSSHVRASRGHRAAFEPLEALAQHCDEVHPLDGVGAHRGGRWRREAHIRQAKRGPAAARMLLRGRHVRVGAVFEGLRAAEMRVPFGFVVVLLVGLVMVVLRPLGPDGGVPRADAGRPSVRLRKCGWPWPGRRCDDDGGLPARLGNGERLAPAEVLVLLGVDRVLVRDSTAVGTGIHPRTGVRA